MVQPLKIKKSDLFELWYFLKHNVHPDFYLTENQKRVFITEYKIFRKILRQSHSILVSENKGRVEGVIMLWKAVGGDKKRTYVKINAISENIANKLLTVLLWDCNNVIYIKIKKYSPYLNLFKEKNFFFAGGRGRELLLCYKKRIYDKKQKSFSHRYKDDKK